MTAKKTKKENGLELQIPVIENHSAQNAEQAYKILTEIQVGDKTLFDIVFDAKESNEFIGKLNNTQRAEFIKLIKENEKSGGDRTQFLLELVEKFPNAIDQETTTAMYEIKKVLLINGEKTRQLAELYTGKKIIDFKEAVGYAFLYIIFLKQV